MKRHMYVRHELEPFTVPAEGAAVVLRRVRPLLDYVGWAGGDLVKLLACAYVQGLLDGEQARKMAEAAP